MSDDEPVKKKRKQRLLTSCVRCHKRRIKCDRQRPCHSCNNYGRSSQCIYQGEQQERLDNPRASSSSTLTSSTSTLSAAAVAPSSAASNISGSDLPTLAFSTFVTLFEQHSRNDTLAKGGIKTSIQYSDETTNCIHSARLDLPTPAKIRQIVVFFVEELDWLCEVLDYDAMESWLDDFSERMCRKESSSSESAVPLQSGDATRLALVVMVILATSQVFSETTIGLYFADAPTASFSPAFATRNNVVKCYESHLRHLLEAASSADGSSVDLIRCVLLYMHFLKNAARYGESSNRSLILSISKLVEQIHLQVEPDESTYTKMERESRKRLFGSFYSFDRMSASHLLFDIQIKDSKISIQEPSEEVFTPLMGKRIQLNNIFRIRLARIGGQLAQLLKSKEIVSYLSIKLLQEQLDDVESQLPTPLALDLKPLEASLRSMRYFDLQRHLLHIVFYHLRVSINRLGFFPNKIVSSIESTICRNRCADAACNSIRVLENFRLKVASEHHLRSWYLPYFLIESSITLIFASLTEWKEEVGEEKHISRALGQRMKMATKAKDLLESIPIDYTPALDGARFIARVLSRSESILHNSKSVDNTNRQEDMQSILAANDGGRLPIPFLETIEGAGTGRHNKEGVIKDTIKASVSMSTSTNESCELGLPETPSNDADIDHTHASLSDLFQRPDLLASSAEISTGRYQFPDDTLELDQQLETWLSTFGSSV